MTTYARRLGLFSGTMAVVGGIIGGGIFRTPAVVAERLGSPALILAAWAAGGVVALLGALCFAELGQRRPRAGGGYVYLRETWGPLPAFLYGWALLLVIASGAIAAVAVTFADYTVALTGASPTLTLPLAVGAIALLAGVNYVGVRPGAVVQNVFTVLKLAALAGLIVAGLAAAAPAAAPPVVATATGFGPALVPILFTFGGWQQTNFIAEEMIEPERQLPRALVLGVSIVVLVYLLANLAYLRALGADGLAASTAPAADLLRQVAGPTGATLIAAGIAASTFGFLNLVILVTPRVFQAMAVDGVFFPRLARLHPVHRTPAAAIVTQAVWASVLVLSGSFSQLVDYVSFADWSFFALTAAALFRYRSRDRASGIAPPAEAFRMPGYPWTPALFVVAALAVVASSVAANPRNALIGVALIAGGVPIYVYWRHRRPGGSAPLLLPLVGPFARLVTHAYYRVTVAGRPLPARGPLLLVANHPNEVFDPLLVAAAGERPVRFLAKATLFGVPGVGAVLRAAGCLPVYRRSDDPALTARNDATFNAVAAALAEGAAVAIFPEGTSHDAPAMAPLKTGAARIALGAAAGGLPVAIVPVGLVLADRDRARSEALVVLGPPVEWDDLREKAAAGETVRELTGRITTALAGVTVNLDAWADEPLVTTAEAIYAATHEVSPDPADRVRRLWVATRWLRALRRTGDPRYPPLAAAVKAHGRKLARLGLEPRDLDQPTDLGTAVRWTGRQIPLLLAGTLALLGLLLISGPMILADLAARSGGAGAESRASRHLYAGGALVLLWWSGLALAVGLLRGPPAGLATLLLLPPAGFTGLWVQHAWGHRLHQARRWLFLRFGGEWRLRLLREQADIGLRLADLVASPPAEAVR